MPGKRAAAAIAGLTALLACGRSPAAPGSSSSGRFDVIIPGAGVSIGGVLFRPEIAPGSARPGLVVVHGHLPAGVNGAATVEGVARRFRDRGYVALAMSMRGWPPSSGADDCALQQPDDVVEVVEWLKRQPGVDAAHIGLVGFSKGGQVVLLAAARHASAQAAVAYYPPTDLARWLVTTARADTPVYIERMCRPDPGLGPRSPVTQAAQLAMPVLLVHGDADSNVPLEQSQLMADALRAAGRPGTLFIVPGGGHGFDPAAAELANPVVDAFFAAHLARD